MLLGLVLAGCSKSPVPVLDLKISDGDSHDYNRSLEIITDRQTPEERSEFAKALQELKYQAMFADRRQPGTELNAAVRTQLAGLSVRDVLVLGHTIKVGRKKDEEQALLRSILMNQRLRTRLDDEASASFLEETRANQAKQMQALRAEISALEQRFQELDPTRSRSRPPIVPGEELDEQPVLGKPGSPSPGKPF